MRFRVTKLINATVGTRQSERLEQSETRFAGELRVDYLLGDITFTRTHIGIIVEGDIEAQTAVQCVRSLEWFDLPLSFALEDALFTPLNQAPIEQDDDRIIGDDGMIDLTETLRQHIVLALPINPISPKYRDSATLSALVGDEDAEWLTVKWSGSDHADKR